jgi:hypothetical protein
LTAGVAINTAGTITGFYENSKGNSGGYIRAPSGAITKFEATGSGTSAGNGTVGFGINPAGEVVGYFLTSAFVFEGFVRSK